MSKPVKKQPRHVWYTRWTFWVGLAVVLALLSAGVILKLLRSPAPSVSVVSPISYNEGGEVYIAGTGRHYVVVGVEVKNPTNEVFHFAPVLQVYLTDTNGVRYDMAPVELERPIEAGEIQPGEVRKGQLSFNVPKNVSKLDFHFVTDDKYQISYTQHL